MSNMGISMDDDDAGIKGENEFITCCVQFRGWSILFFCYTCNGKYIFKTHYENCICVSRKFVHFYSNEDDAHDHDDDEDDAEILRVDLLWRET